MVKETTKTRNSEFHIIQRKQHQIKKFFVINLMTGEKELFFNQSECARKYNIPQPRISHALRGNGKYKFYHFEYAKS